MKTNLRRLLSHTLLLPLSMGAMQINQSWLMPHGDEPDEPIHQSIQWQPTATAQARTHHAPQGTPHHRRHWFW